MLPEAAGARLVGIRVTGLPFKPRAMGSAWVLGATAAGSAPA